MVMNPHLSPPQILTYRRVLDIKKGILTQLLSWKSEKGKITRFESFRLVHLCHKHTTLIKGIVVPENYNGTITIKGGLDGILLTANSGSTVYWAPKLDKMFLFDAEKRKTIYEK